MSPCSCQIDGVSSLQNCGFMRDAAHTMIFSTYNEMQHMQRRRDGWRVSVSVGTIVATRRHRYQHRFSVALKHVIVKCQSVCCTTCSVHNVHSSIARYTHKCGENVSFSSYPKVHVLGVRFELRATFLKCSNLSYYEVVGPPFPNHQQRRPFLSFVWHLV